MQELGLDRRQRKRRAHLVGPNLSVLALRRERGFGSLVRIMVLTKKFVVAGIVRLQMYLCDDDNCEDGSVM